MSIVSLAIAVAYLLTIVAGTVGALLVLIWLFQDAPDADTTIESETFRDLRDIERLRSGSTSSAQLEESERPKDEAA